MNRKRIFRRFGLLFSVILATAMLFFVKEADSECLLGAFLADRPADEDIAGFRKDYGKSPFLISVFVDWGNFIDEQVIQDVYSVGSVLLIAWEPWDAILEEGVDCDEILAGDHDEYIYSFATRMKAIGGDVFIRFGHEMNGCWYPWSGLKIGSDKYISVYRYINDFFSDANVSNVKWVFSINWEDVPRKDNHYMLYYPGDDYVDYVGLDGYNWGTLKPTDKWMSFEEIFKERYDEISEKMRKPIIITEFSSSSCGGDKAKWIRDAMRNIKKMKNIKAFVLFNVDKETDWSFPVSSRPGRSLRKQLRSRYFIKDRD